MSFSINKTIRTKEYLDVESISLERNIKELFDLTIITKNESSLKLNIKNGINLGI